MSKEEIQATVRGGDGDPLYNFVMIKEEILIPYTGNDGKRGLLRTLILMTNN